LSFVLESETLDFHSRNLANPNPGESSICCFLVLWSETQANPPTVANPNTQVNPPSLYVFLFFGLKPRRIHLQQQTQTLCFLVLWSETQANPLTAANPNPMFSYSLVWNPGESTYSSKPKSRRILHHVFLFFGLTEKLSRGGSSSIKLDLFTLDLAQQNGVLWTWFVRLLNSFKTLLTNEIVWGIWLFWKKIRWK